MGNAKYTDGGYTSTESMPVRYADVVINDLVQGKPVAREAVDEAKETLIEQLWSNKASTAGQARHGLSVLYANAANASDKGELIGELIAAGIPAKQTLNDILNFDTANGLDRGEIDSIINSLNEPVKDRFASVVSLYVNSLEPSGTGNGGSQDGDGPGGRFPVRSAPLPQIPEPKGNSVEGRRETPDGDGPIPDEASITNSDLSMETRLDNALKIGSDAVPILIKLLQNPNRAEQEFAYVTLYHLGQTDGAGTDVYHRAHRLEGDLEYKDIASQIRRSVKGAGGADDQDFHSRDRAKRANVPDRWMQSAFASGDAPSILRAAAGREILAIPMLVSDMVKRRRS